MFLLGAHLAECELVSVRQKDRVVAKALRAARREHQRAVNASLEFFEVTIRPGEA